MLTDMFARRLGFGGILALTITLSCDGEGGTDANPDQSFSDIDPPKRIDITTCYDVIDAGNADSISRCSDCCNGSGMSVGSFIYDGHCTCANPSEPNITLCAAKTAASDICNDCCEAAQYGWSSWLGGETPSCSCDMLTDRNICKSTLSRSNPAEQCAICCLDHGFINAMFVGLGTAECSCIAP